eukprot:9339967-Heterocapsa_arctica.AAC.1
MKTTADAGTRVATSSSSTPAESNNRNTSFDRRRNRSCVRRGAAIHVGKRRAHPRVRRDASDPVGKRRAHPS